MVLPARHARAAGPAAVLAAVYAVATTVGPTADTRVSDLYLYRSITRLLADGLWPYRGFDYEYPPLSVVPIALGGAFGLGEDAYAVTFGALMLGCLLVLQAWAGALAGRRARWAVAVCPLLLGAMVRTHYDLVPAALVAGALALLARGRTSSAFAALGVGTAVKLFPALLVPLACAWLLGRGEGRRIVPALTAFTGVVLAACLPFAGPGFTGQFTFHLERPVQIESTPAVVLSVIGESYVTGTEERPDRFKSNGLDGGPADAVAAVFQLLLALAYLAVVLLATRGGDVRRLTLLGLAAVTAFIALGKVLSPQYMIWLLPFAAAAWAWRERAIVLLCAAASLLTLLEFPRHYFDVVAQEPLWVAVVGVRDGTLLALLGVSLARVAGSPRSTPPAAGPRSAPAPP